MTRQSLLAIFVAASVSTSITASASPLGSLMAHVHRNPAAQVAKVKTVDVYIRNRVLIPRQVLIGAAVVTLQPNHTSHFIVPVNTEIYSYSRMQSHAPGSLLLQAKDQRAPNSVTVD